MLTSKSTTSSIEARLGLSISLIIHALLLGVILTSRTHYPAPVAVMDVTIEPPSALNSRTKEIVSPPAERAIKPPEDTNKLSDLDSLAVKEQVQRGDNGGLPGAPSQSQQPQQPQQPKQAQEQQRPAKQPPTEKQPEHASNDGHPLKNLKLDDATLAMKFGSQPSKATKQSSNAAPAATLNEYQAFSRPPGSGAAFLGNAGINDHLPNLPDGDITLLNAKANIYASFVRRVAVQVFTQLRSQGWEKLSQQQIQQLSDFTTIEAVLSRQGKLLSVRILSSSGSTHFDSVVNLSVSAGVRDPNPPPGAEAQDGAIHFIFKARSWSQMGFNRRSGASQEQRWLLLATGLE